MCEKFRSVLNYVAGSVAYGIWNDLNPGINKDIDTIDSMKEFIDFFAFAISENVIVEYDCEKNCPVFSGDQPIVVANRIFDDFFLKKIQTYQKNHHQIVMILLRTCSAKRGGRFCIKEHV